jgi:hypothetical protein
VKPSHSERGLRHLVRQPGLRWTAIGVENEIVPMQDEIRSWTTDEAEVQAAKADQLSNAVAVGSILPGLIMPADVRQLISKTTTDIATLQASVDSAPDLPPAEKSAWDAFVKSWKAYDKEVSYIPVVYLKQYHDIVEQFQLPAREWESRIQLARGGKLAGPSIQPKNPSTSPSGSGEDPWWKLSASTIALLTLAGVGTLWAGAWVLKGIAPNLLPGHYAR